MAERNAVIFFLIRPAARLLDNRILLMSRHKVAAEHDHARHPEEQDLVGCNQKGRRIEHFLVPRLLRPAQGRERQQPRREPCIEHVRILLQLAVPAIRTLSGNLACHHHALTLPAVPHRNAVSPPQLARDTPVIDVVHPVQINLPVILGDNRDLALLHRRDRMRGQGLDLHEPLR